MEITKTEVKCLPFSLQCNVMADENTVVSELESDILAVRHSYICRGNDYWWAIFEQKIARKDGWIFVVAAL